VAGKGKSDNDTPLTQMLEEIMERLERIEARIDQKESNQDVEMALKIMERQGYISADDIRRHPSLGPRYAGKRWKISSLLNKVDSRCDCKTVRMGKGGKRYLYTSEGERKIHEIAAQKTGDGDARYIATRMRRLKKLLDAVDEWMRPVSLRQLVLDNMTLSLSQYEHLIAEAQKVPAFQEFRIFTYENEEWIHKMGTQAEEAIATEADEILARAKKETENGNFHPAWLGWTDMPLPPEIINRLDEEITELINQKRRAFQQEKMEKRKVKEGEIIKEFLNYKTKGKEPEKGWYIKKAKEMGRTPEQFKDWLNYTLTDEQWLKDAYGLELPRTP